MKILKGVRFSVRIKVISDKEVYHLLQRDVLHKSDFARTEEIICSLQS